MLSTVKDILLEHNLSDHGEGNSYIASESVPLYGNFEGKIWYNLGTGTHHIYHDGRFISLHEEVVYGGMTRKMKTDSGTFEIVEKLDERGRVLHRSTLSSPNSNGLFTNRKVESNIGLPAQRVDNYALTYDSDGDLISEKKK